MILTLRMFIKYIIDVIIHLLIELWHFKYIIKKKRYIMGAIISVLGEKEVF
jgi:hypothetical protein